MIEETTSERRTRPLDARSVPDLFRGLADDATDLIRQEIALARLELRQNLRDVARNTGRLAVGGSVVAVGALVLVVFLIVGLGVLLGDIYWLSTLLVAIALLVGGVGLAYAGGRRLGSSVAMPDETIESIRVTGEWASEEVAELKRTFRGDEAEGERPSGHTAEPTISVERRSADEQAREAGASSGSETATPADSRLPLSTPIYKRVLHEISEDDVIGQGAKVAYFMFTSLPPALLVLFSLAGFFGGPALGDFLAAQMEGALPGTAEDPNSAAGFISQFVEQVVTQQAPGPLSVGLLIGIWAGSTIFVALSDSLNKAYDVREDRSWLKRRAIAIGVMIGFVALFLLGSALLIAGPQIAEALQLGGAANLAWSVLQWPLAFLLVVLAFYLVYYALPDRDQSGVRGVLFAGSAIAAALWVLATLGFRLYIANFGSYGDTYGFVGAILVLLLWMYLTGIVMLVGGEISSEMERKA